MLTFENFTGINNVLRPDRIGDGALVEAVNVDIDSTGAVSRRQGYSLITEGCHKNLWQARGFLLATRSGGELVAISSAGVASLHPLLGVSRVWYCNLPDGRTTFSNGYICGITDGVSITSFGIQVPPTTGAITPVVGAMQPGDYKYLLTYVRASDGLEGGAIASKPVTIDDGGVLLTGLPVLSGHKINVYITDANGERACFAGSTLTASFSYLGKNDALTLPCRTEHLQPPPAGTVMAFFRGRILVAQGSTLCASLPDRWEAFDPRRDFKQFGAPITLLQPVDGGIYVGTQDELVFLGGVDFERLTYRRVLDGGVCLGSGVAVDGERVRRGDGVGSGLAMLCIAGGGIVAGFADGSIGLMTQGVYKTEAKEFSATVVDVGGALSYVAVPQ